MLVTNGKDFSTYSKGGISLNLFSVINIQDNMQNTANWINEQKLSCT